MYQRLCILPVPETVEIIRKHRVGKLDLQEEIILFGQRVRITGMRLATFFTYGTDCEHCGIKGMFFAVEKQKIGGEKVKTWHLNLYGHTKNGQEVLLTSDHIWPKALRGPDGKLCNRQTLCTKCNSAKRHRLPTPDEQGRLLLHGMAKAHLKELWRYGLVELQRMAERQARVIKQQQEAATKKQQAGQHPIT